MEQLRHFVTLRQDNTLTAEEAAVFRQRIRRLKREHMLQSRRLQTLHPDSKAWHHTNNLLHSLEKNILKMQHDLGNTNWPATIWEDSPIKLKEIWQYLTSHLKHRQP